MLYRYRYVLYMTPLQKTLTIPLRLILVDYNSQNCCTSFFLEMITVYQVNSKSSNKKHGKAHGSNYRGAKGSLAPLKRTWAQSLLCDIKGGSRTLFIFVSHIDFDFLYIKVPEINNNSKTFCFKLLNTHQKHYDAEIKAGWKPVRRGGSKPLPQPQCSSAVSLGVTAAADATTTAGLSWVLTDREQLEPALLKPNNSD